jgi:hypothetical protein
LLGWDATGAELMLEGAVVYIMTGRIDSAVGCITTMMAGFTFIRAVRSVFIITLRKTCEEITKSTTAKIANSIIAIIINGGTNIRDTPGHHRERKIGGNETCDREEWRFTWRKKATRRFGTSGLLIQLEIKKETLTQ